MTTTSRTTAASSRRRRRNLLVVAVVLLLAVVAVTLTALRSDGDDTAPTGALGAGTGIGGVTLRTADLESMRTYYGEAIGLTVHADGPDQVVLGSGDRELLRLVLSDAPSDDVADAGLYHSAFLFPDRATLAQALVRVATLAPASFQGSSDHRVSEAFYLADPDGNGIELYVDRPREEWQWDQGLVRMGSYPLDPNRFIAEHTPATPRSESAIIGHVHLRGGDLTEAEAFYADVLGFAVTARSEGAVFFAADDYHHHLAVNTWSSDGAGPRPDSLGLGALTVHVADDDALDALETRLTDAGVAYERDRNTVRLADPWGTTVIVTAGD